MKRKMMIARCLTASDLEDIRRQFQAKLYFKPEPNNL